MDDSNPDLEIIRVSTSRSPSSGDRVTVVYKRPLETGSKKMVTNGDAQGNITAKNLITSELTDKPSPIFDVMKQLMAGFKSLVLSGRIQECGEELKKDLEAMRDRMHIMMEEIGGISGEGARK